jgi:hypothetical protein
MFPPLFTAYLRALLASPRVTEIKTDRNTRNGYVGLPFLWDQLVTVWRCNEITLRDLAGLLCIKAGPKNSPFLSAGHSSSFSFSSTIHQVMFFSKSIALAIVFYISYAAAAPLPS